jgi:hypothetical protein
MCRRGHRPWRWMRSCWLPPVTDGIVGRSGQLDQPHRISQSVPQVASRVYPGTGTVPVENTITRARLVAVWEGDL